MREKKIDKTKEREREKERERSWETLKPKIPCSFANINYNLCKNALFVTTKSISTAPLYALFDPVSDVSVSASSHIGFKRHTMLNNDDKYWQVAWRGHFNSRILVDFSKPGSRIGLRFYSFL